EIQTLTNAYPLTISAGNRLGGSGAYPRLPHLPLICALVAAHLGAKVREMTWRAARQRSAMSLSDDSAAEERRSCVGARLGAIDRLLKPGIRATAGSTRRSAA